MKKYLVLLIGIVVMLGCTSCEKDKKENVSSMVEYETGSYSEKNWNEPVGTYQEDVLPDKETALAVATAIFHGMEKDTEAQKYTPQSIFYDEEDSIWIVLFHEEVEENATEVVMGGGYSIALQKKDGKVLRIWMGE